MAFSLPNTKLNASVLSGLNPSVGSTALAPSGVVVVGTATATSTSMAESFRWLFGDYTSTQSVPATTQVREGGIGDFGCDHQYYRALVNLKSLTGYGTATSTSAMGLVIDLVAATSTAAWVGTGSTGHSANAYIIDSKVVSMTSNTSTGNTAAYFLFGCVPTALGARYARIEFKRIDNSGATAPSSTALDVVIEGIG